MNSGLPAIRKRFCISFSNDVINVFTFRLSLFTETRPGIAQ